MKFMGSKRYMLANGLGDLLKREAATAAHSYDLFCGSGVVSWFLASETKSRVTSVDLQEFATALADAVVTRTKPLDVDHLKSVWIGPGIRRRNDNRLWKKASQLEDLRITRANVLAARELCTEPVRVGPVWNAYGGHYFSPKQALTFDYLLSRLPDDSSERSTCLAALIRAASRCAAAPGHTAQPFQPSRKANKAIAAAWWRDPIEEAVKALKDLAPRVAQLKGSVKTGDAHEEAEKIKKNSLVFVDPPYSAVQYSRFYHVLETIATYQRFSALGTGRYPPLTLRPQSEYSNRGTSHDALDCLLSRLAERECRVLVTFPAGESSNGLSGDGVVDIGTKYFRCDLKYVIGQFSTLGGNHTHRSPRHESRELILLLRPL